MSVDTLPAIYQLRVRLYAISPLIWRRILVRTDTSIAFLHHSIQLAFGWTDSHLHRFVIHGKAYGIAYVGGISLAIAVQTGGPDLVFVALGQIAQWIEANEYQIAGPYREIGIELPTSGTFDDMVVEVQIPIEQMPGASDMLRNSGE